PRCAATHGIDFLLCGPVIRQSAIFGCDVTRTMRFRQRDRCLPAMFRRALIISLDWSELGALLNTSQLRALEKHRRWNKEIKHKHHGPDEENEKLHRNFGDCIEQQAQAALRDG